LRWIKLIRRNENIYISKGENSAGLSVNGYFHDSDYCIFELLHDGKVIGGGRH